MDSAAAFADAVHAVLDTVNFGIASAAKRGRTPKFPYVPVIVYSSQATGAFRARTTQIKGVAYVTGDEAKDCAQRMIDKHRVQYEANLMRPGSRALRESHGLPRELPPAP